MENYRLTTQKIAQLVFPTNMDTAEIEDDLDFDIESFDLDEIDYDDLLEVELEKRHIKNLREEAALLSGLITKDSQIFYGIPARSFFEVSASYKWATKRGANFRNIKIYNLLFRFRNEQLNAATSAAAMFRDKDNRFNILLLPDNTIATVQAEKEMYKGAAMKLLIQEGMKSEYHSFLLENLRLLNRNERCAQSLLHEYGHVLHYRLFDVYGLNTASERLQWFLDIGYFEIINERIEGLQHYDVEDIFYLLKESFAEDCRIYFNWKQHRNMYILPNANTFINDFKYPQYLNEGVNLVGQAIENKLPNYVNGMLAKDSSEQEQNRVERARKMLENHKKYKGSPKMTKEDMKNMIEQLRKKEQQNNNLQPLTI